MLRIMSFLEEATGKELVLPVTPAKYFWRHPNGSRRSSWTSWGDQSAGRLQDGGLHSGGRDPPLPSCTPSACRGPGRPLTSTCMTWRCGATGGQAAVDRLRHQRQRLGDDRGDHTGGAGRHQRPVPHHRHAAVEKSRRSPSSLCPAGAPRPHGTARPGRRPPRPTRCRPGTACGPSRSGTMAAEANTAPGGGQSGYQNPNLIYPGQVLTIPAADDLPTAGPDSASVALADATASVWDPVAQSWTLK